jgi:hypothetical protein
MASQFESNPKTVNLFRKLLKTLIFISQKFLDTPLFRLIRFRQKVLTALPPLELFSLERKGRLLPGGLFVWCSVVRGAIKHKRTGSVTSESVRGQRWQNLRTGRAIDRSSAAFVPRLGSSRAAALASRLRRKKPRQNGLSLGRGDGASMIKSRNFTRPT